MGLSLDGRLLVIKVAFRLLNVGRHAIEQYIIVVVDSIQ